MMDIAQLEEYFEFFHPVHHTLTLSANHGVGKSQVVKNNLRAIIARRHGIEIDEVGFIDKRAAQLEPADLSGGIFMVGSRTYNAPPSWLPVHKDSAAKLSKALAQSGTEWVDFEEAEVGILFLDEINRAQVYTKQALFELKLDRSLHGVKIPDTWYIICAENGNPDLYDVSEVEPADKDREVTIQFQPSYQEFLDFLDRKTAAGLIHESIRAYLVQNEDKIDPTEDEIRQAIADSESTQSRRSWDRLGEALMVFEKNNGTANGKALIKFASTDKGLLALRGAAEGHVGMAQAQAYSQFVKEEYDMLSPDIILNNYSLSAQARVKAMGDIDGDNSNSAALAGLNDAIVEKLGKLGKGVALSELQQKNIVTHLQLCGRELVTGFWKNWTKVNNAQAVDWHTTYLRRALITRSITPAKGYENWVDKQTKLGHDLTSDERIK